MIDPFNSTQVCLSLAGRDRNKRKRIYLPSVQFSSTYKVNAHVIHFSFFSRLFEGDEDDAK